MSNSSRDMLKTGVILLPWVLFLVPFWKQSESPLLVWSMCNLVVQWLWTWTISPRLDPLHTRWYSKFRGSVPLSLELSGVVAMILNLTT
jgi:hypothetical protein